MLIATFILNYDFSFRLLVFVFFFVCASLFLTPISFAESAAVGRVNSPRTANLALRAGIARQGGLVGNGCRFRHPERFFLGKRIGTAFSGYSFGL